MISEYKLIMLRSLVEDGVIELVQEQHSLQKGCDWRERCGCGPDKLIVNSEYQKALGL